MLQNDVAPGAIGTRADEVIGIVDIERLVTGKTNPRRDEESAEEGNFWPRRCRDIRTRVENVREDLEDKVSACGVAGKDKVLWVYTGVKKLFKSLVGVD